MLQTMEVKQKDYTIVRTKADYDRMMTHIEYHDYLAFDVESTGVNVRKDRVIGYSVSGAEGVGYYLPILYWCVFDEKLKEFPRTWDYIKPLQVLCRKELLMWNASFDVRITRNNLGINLMDALTADVMLMKHTVEEDGKFKLKEVAIEKQHILGLDMEKEANEEQIALKANVAKNGGSTTKTNYEMYKADLDVMGPYAAADTDLTLRLGNYYMGRLEEEGLSDFFFDEEVMPLYKEVTIKMEDKGIVLDLDLINKTDDSIKQDLVKLETQVIDELLETKEFNSWLTNTAREKFPPKKTGSFAQQLIQRSSMLKRNLPQSPKTGKYSLTKANLMKLPECLEKLFLLDFESLLPEDFEALNCEGISISMWKEKEGNYINISSKKQMGDFVFDYMGIEPLTKTAKGAPQFNDAMIQHLADEYNFEWAKTLSNYNKLVKIKGAYIDRFLDAQEDGVFYPYFKQHGTISGRFSSDLQQLPRPMEEGEGEEIVRKYVNEIRAFFIAKEGRKFVDADYESLEPHVFSDVSGDEGLRNIFRKGHDFYSTIAIATEKLEGVSADKKALNYLGKVNKPLRQSAKAYSLGIPYGLSPYALSKSLDVDIEEAQRLYDGYLGGFPELRKWMDNSKDFVHKNGYIKTKLGRCRHLPKVKELYEVHGEKLLDFKYRNKLQAQYQRIHRLSKAEAKDKVTNIYRDYKNGVNNSRNFQIQGLSASIVNRAMIQINRELINREIDGWVCATVHDQIIVDCPEERIEECKELVEDIMCNIVKLSVDLKAPPEESINFRDGH